MTSDTERARKFKDAEIAAQNACSAWEDEVARFSKVCADPYITEEMIEEARFSVMAHFESYVDALKHVGDLIRYARKTRMGKEAQKPQLRLPSPKPLGLPKPDDSFPESA